MTERKPAPLASISELPLVDAKGKEILASSLWAEQAIFLLFIRRPGCVICRAEARRVWTLKDTFDLLGIRPVVLVHEWLPAEVNAFKPFWGGEVYLDKTKDFYKALGEGKLRKGSYTSFFCGICCLVPKYNEAKTIAPDSKSNMNGTHLVMGGNMLVKQGKGGVQFQFTEDSFGDHPDYEMVLHHCEKAVGKSLTEEEMRKAIAKQKLLAKRPSRASKG